LQGLLDNIFSGVASLVCHSEMKEK
jgi:hypothetical protein